MKENSIPDPKFTEEQLRYLEKNIPALVVAPGMALDAIQYQAGTCSVVEFVRKNVGFVARTRHRDR